MNTVTFAAINILLFSSWYVLLLRGRRTLLFVDRLIAVFTLGLAQIIFTEMLLGVVFKSLYALQLFTLNASISIVVLTVGIMLYRRELLAEKNKNIRRGFIKDVIGEVLDKSVKIIKVIMKDRVLCLITFFFLLSVCWMIFLGYLFPSYTWDALWYHLPIVGNTLQSGAIQDNAAPSLIDIFINIFPKNIELFFVWNTIFLKSDIIVDLSQLLFAIMGVMSVYSIALKTGLDQRRALYSGLLFFFAPVVILQSTTNYVDVAVGVLFLMAVNFLLYDGPHDFSNGGPGHLHQNRSVPIIISGTAAGLLLGAKGSGPLFIMIILAAVAARDIIENLKPFNSFRSANEPYSLKKRLKLYLGCFMVPVMLLGSYWYIKNWILYGNPVYPIRISFMDITLFEGLFEDNIDPIPQVFEKMPALVTPFYTWMERVEYYLYDSRFSGFGPVWFILLLPSIVVALWQSIKKKKYNFLFVSAILVITFVLYPRNWYPRYVIFFLGLGALSFGMTLDYFRSRQNVIRSLVLFLVVYTFLTANSPCIMPLKIKEFLGLPREERTIARLAPFNIDLQARQEYGLWIWVDNNMSDGDTLAYTFEPLFLSPLWNSGFTNRVKYVKSENFKDWIKELKDNEVTHILVRQRSVEDRWIDEVKLLLQRLWWAGGPSESFDVVYSDKNYKVFRFSVK